MTAAPAPTTTGSGSLRTADDRRDAGEQKDDHHALTYDRRQLREGNRKRVDALLHALTVTVFAMQDEGLEAVGNGDADRHQQPADEGGTHQGHRP